MTAFTVGKVAVFLQIYMLTRSNDVDGVFVKAADDIAMDKKLQTGKMALSHVNQGAECKPRKRVRTVSPLSPSSFLYPTCIEVMVCEGDCGNDLNICCMVKDTTTRNITLYSFSGGPASFVTYKIVEHTNCTCSFRSEAPKNCSVHLQA